MKSSVKISGIDIIGPAPWGTHFCVFYQTKDDLLDILIPYFKVGLENNEYCMWVTSEPLNEKDAEKAMRAAIPDFDKYLRKNQIEIIPYTEWYVENNEFDSQRVLNGWVDKCNYALDNGFKGLRLTGNTFWLEDKDWKGFTDYEEEVNNVISSYKMIAVCTYSLKKCGSFEILDVVRNHQYALFRREGSWEIFKSTEQTKIELELKESEQKYRVLFESSKDGIVFSNMKGKIIDCNQAYLDILGYTQSEIKEFTYQQLTPEKWHEMEGDIFNNQSLPKGYTDEFEKEYIRKDGTIAPISIKAWLIEDDQGNNKGMWAIVKDISDRKKKEEEIRLQSEIIENMSEGVNLIKLDDGTIVFTNPAFEEMFGYNPGEMIGKNIAVVNAPTDKTPEETREAIMGILKDTGEWHGEVLNVKKDGTSFWCYANVSLFDHPEYGRVIVSVHTDITDRKKADQKSEASEENYKTLSKELEIIMDSVPALIFYKDSENNFIRVNKLIADAHKTTKEVLEGKNLFNLYPKEQAQAYWDDDLEVIKSGESKLFFEEPWETAEDTRWLSTSKIPYFDEKGDIIGIIGFSTDITERKKAEQQLKESEEKFRMLFNTANDTIFIVDLEGNIIECNKTSNERLGYTRDELLSMTPMDLDTPEYAEGVLDRIEIVRQKGELFYEVEHLRKDGKILPVEINSKLINFQGKTAILSIVRDITERKKIEQELKESEEKWRALSENSPAHVLLLDREHKILFINRAVPDLSKEEVIGASIFNYTPQEFHKVTRDCYYSVWETGEPSSITTKYGTKEGDTKYFDMWVGPVFQSEKVVALITHSMDITKRKKIEQELKESEEKFRLIAEQTLIGINITQNKIIKYINKAFAEMHEYSVEEMYGWTLNDLVNNVHPDDLPLVREMAKSRETGDKNIHHYSFRTITKSKKIKWLDIVSKVIQYEGKSALLATITDITEIKQIEEKLKESEHNLGERVKELTCLFRLSKLVENTSIFLEDIINGTLNLIPPAFQFPEITTSRITFNGKEYKFENFEETECKLSITVEVNEKPLLIEVYYLEDKPFLKEELDLIREVGVRLKVTLEEKEAQNKLRISEEKYRMGFESSTDGIASADMEGTFLDFNNVFLEMLGYSREELLKLSFREITPQKWHEMEDNLIISQLADGKDSGIYEKEYIRKNGTILPINSRFWIIKDDQEDPVRMWKIVRDITERKKAEEEIASLAKFPSEDPYPVLRVNKNIIIYVNDSGKNLLNVKENDEIPFILQKEINEAFESNSITESEIKLKNRFYSFAITPLREKGYVNIYGMDITEKKQVEQKLKEINKLKSEFLRRASHELKTPLISIKGFSDLILALHRDQINPDVISKLDEINQGCERLQNIINNLLTTSRLESPDIEPKVQREDLTFLIKFCVHELQSLAQTRNQSINLDIHDGQYAMFEKEEMHDVISNLLTNAIKYTPPNGKIDVKTDIQGKNVVISIKDNGIGFTNDEKTKIFQQFGKIERYGQGLDLGIDGTGLGLYISKRIVESHGGKIWMESEGKDKGSTFHFSLPLVRD